MLLNITKNTSENLKINAVDVNTKYTNWLPKKDHKYRLIGYDNSRGISDSSDTDYINF